MITNPQKTVKNSLALVTALFGCGMTLATIAPVYALSSSSVTHTPTLSSSLISKQATPANTSEIDTTCYFPSFKSAVSKYGSDQKKRLIDILNSKEAQEAGSIEELSKIIGDENLKIAIQKDLSNFSQANRFTIKLILWHLIYISINIP